MEIHKPKAAHSWREFSIEIGTIICGILIALGLEQAVEWFHWQRLANEAETHLAAGLQEDVALSADWLMVQPCMSSRLRGLADELAKPGPSWEANRQPARADLQKNFPLPVVVGGFTRIMSHVAWDTALGSGVLNHLPRERVQTYDEVYRMAAFMRDRQPALRVAAARLAPLGYDRRLSDAERTAFISEIGEVAGLEEGMFNSAGQIIRDAGAMGIEPSDKVLAWEFDTERQRWGECVQRLRLPAADAAPALHGRGAARPWQP